MKRVDVVSAIIYDEEENMLMVKNVKGYWELPGGTVEKGEHLQQAVVREVKEETGYVCKINELHSVREAFFQDKKHHALMITFFAEITGGQMSILDPDHDIEEVKWVNTQTFQKLNPKLYNMLKLKQKPKAFYEFEGNRTIG
ncbi:MULTISPECIES: NUDIX hydrolase [unclassified Bacillus (in: firmicutes)]|uniref:NUDIX hydrolase n=1 Tax=unclassified Bacillus (in: firmicutes) TaxID=185979 RepID=UPI000D0358E7|nr:MULTISPECIES: NUDIX hydrolase [unclassified Bacillus (in: firmicutes)]PRR93273.1 NUDIX domain-containing protein [Bacillus sp. NMCN1]PRS00826.1 NUDIX domain-containing protein [Bacillus sp. NMCN6]